MKKKLVVSIIVLIALATLIASTVEKPVCIMKSYSHSYYLSDSFFRKTLKQVSNLNNETVIISNEVAEVLHCDYGPIVYKDTSDVLQVSFGYENFPLGKSTLNFVEGSLVFYTDFTGTSRVFNPLYNEHIDLPEGKIIAHANPFIGTLFTIEQPSDHVDLYAFIPNGDWKLEQLADNAKLVTPLHDNTEVFAWLNDSTLSVIIDYMDAPEIISTSCQDATSTYDGTIITFTDESGTHTIDYYSLMNQFVSQNR